jgi:RNA polymerase sigma-70 factor (ECF subfamily)
MVLTAGQWPLGSAAQRAMNMLAQAYWFPLYAYLRRQGCDPTQAEDLVQGFFTHLLDKEALANVDQSKGKFRTFLLVSLKNYQRNVIDAKHAQKRGGGQRVLSLDTAKAEMRYAVEPVDAMTPDRMYEKQWALAVLDQVLEHLRQDYASRQQLETFTALQHVLDGSAGQPYAVIATQLNLTKSAVKVAAHRLRRRYRQLLREEIAQTVSDPDMVEEEIKELLNCL